MMLHNNSKSVNVDSLRRLFSACDVNKSGRIEYEDLKVVCRELNVPNAEIKALFDKLDMDQDGYIDFSDFSARYNEVSETLDFALFEATQNQRSAWEEFEDRMEGGVIFLGRSREHLAELYQQIHSSSDFFMLQKFEALIITLVSEGKDHSMESQQLEGSLRRTEETTTRQLTELEEELQQQLARVEHRVREEEGQRLETTIAAIQRRHEDQVAELQAAVERLKKFQEDSLNTSLRVDVNQLKSQLLAMTQENEHLHHSLKKAQVNTSILQVELDELKNNYEDQRQQHEREIDYFKKMMMECQSYSNHISVLQDINKKLYDSNDGLRSTLAQNMVSNKRLLSPRDRNISRRLKPIQQSTLNHSSFVDDKSQYSHVASWADKYLDSGLSVDAVVISSSEYDSDDSQDHSFSYVPSDVEVSDVKSEAVPSRCSSISSSIRRRLSAFPSKANADYLYAEASAPTYKLVLAGDAGSGKSSFLLRLSKNEFRAEIQTTLGVDFQMKKMLVDGEKTNLQIWDTAGQERFRSIARSYFRKAHGALLLYDITSESSFLNVRDWVDQIQDSTDKHIPMCVVGNKVDLRGERPETSCVSPSQGEKLAMAYNALFCETSAKEGTNVVEAVLHLAREVKRNVKLRRRSEPQMRLSLAERKEKLGRCCGV